MQDDEHWVKPAVTQRTLKAVREEGNCRDRNVSHYSDTSRCLALESRIRGWELYVVNCRSNHIHVVVAANIGPEAVRSQFKAWCTRKLKELERQRDKGDVRENWWANAEADFTSMTRTASKRWSSMSATARMILNTTTNPKASAEARRQSHTNTNPAPREGVQQSHANTNPKRL